MSRSARLVGTPRCWLGIAGAWMVATFIQMITNPNLDRLLAAAVEVDASDLHLVAGVPPAFRVNGEIILADQDALSDKEVSEMSDSVLNEQKKRKFEQDWELCISLMNQQDGRFRGRLFSR